MRNLIKSIVLSLFVSTFQAQIHIGKIDTIRFAADSSYSRAMLLWKDQLIIGTSKTGVKSFHLESKEIKTLIPERKAGEYRDLALFGNTLYAITSGDTGLIMAYENGFVSEKLNVPNAFFDDIQILKNNLLLLGDPMHGEFYLNKINLKTHENNAIASLKNNINEACYAGSGTTAGLIGKDYCFVSGGGNSARFHRLHKGKWKTVNLPMNLGDGAGPFSIYCFDKNKACIVGGNYLKKDLADSCSVFTSDGGKTWTLSEKQCQGYRCALTCFENKVLFACGSTGIDVSYDYGKNWESFLKGNFCKVLSGKEYLYASTNKGYILKISICEKELALVRK